MHISEEVLPAQIISLDAAEMEKPIKYTPFQTVGKSEAELMWRLEEFLPCGGLMCCVDK